LYYQASTRGERKITRWLSTKGDIKRGAQVAGALVTAYGLKEKDEKIILAGAATFLSSFLISTAADTRCSEILPAETHILPFNLSNDITEITGVELRFYNLNSAEITRFRQVYHLPLSVLKSNKPSIYYKRVYTTENNTDNFFSEKYLNLLGEMLKKNKDTYIVERLSELKRLIENGFNIQKASVTKDSLFKYCFDTIGHRAGTYPYILGGTCCCTPTSALLKQYQKDGFLINYTFDSLIDEYKKLGIAYQSDKHRNCNNYCVDGPHIVNGGKCMVPPTPLTRNFIEVLTGIQLRKDNTAFNRTRLNREKIKPAPIKKEKKPNTLN
ncbi:MAG: hypothetical protein QME51_11050, partial [Planctomycetota bacterium]|nr:hypothetical protein [Planctomycetota bacterium]